MIFKKKKDNILLIDHNKAATQFLNNISDIFSNCPAEDIFFDFPEIVEDIDTCFFEKTSCSREISHTQDNYLKIIQYLKFTCTYLEPDILFVIVENIKKSEIIQNALLEHKEMTELAINATTTAVWDLNYPTGDVIFNEHWTTMLGYMPNEIPGHLLSWKNLLHPDDKEYAIEKLEDHIKGKTSNYRAEYRLLCKNGAWMWALDKGLVVKRDDDGCPIRLTGTRINIARHKIFEVKLESLNSKLEKLVDRRTRELKRKEQSLIESRRKLKEKSIHLEEVNNALKIIINKNSENKIEIEENLCANINKLVIPYLDKIEEINPTIRQKDFFKIIRSNIEDIAAPFYRKLTSKYSNLTPAELIIINLIKQGKSSKEIAQLLTLSVKTIETQRRNIRKKIGINNKKINLTTHLQSFE